MTKKRSLDDTCDIFLSRRRRIHSPLTSQHAASQLPHTVPTLRAENIVIPPYFSLPRSEPSASALTSTFTKPLPLPGSSGVAQPRPIRLADGRNHVPRPRNPFILFRCDLVHQRKMLPRSDLDDTNISRIAGDLWRDMTAAQKRPWVELAAQEKARHALLYPDYKYAPTHGGSKSKKTKNDLEDHPPRQVSQMGAASPLVHHAKQRRQAERPRPYPQSIPRRRSSSCPPAGAVPVPSRSPLDEWAPALVTRDDMQRRPSLTVMYQSVTQQPVEPTAPVPAEYNPVALQNFDWLNLPQINPSLQDHTYSLPDMNMSPESYPVPTLSCFDNEPTFIHGICHAGFTAQELTDLERLTIGTAFTDPFSTLATIPFDYGSPSAFSTAISPLDCSATDSPCSSSSGTFSSH